MIEDQFLNRSSATFHTSSVSEVVHDFIDRLIPNGGKGLLGHWAFCKTCEGRAYTRKNESVWQICPDCLAGRCWNSR